MPSVPPLTDARREQLRQQAKRRRQAVLDRIVATRVIAVGVAAAITCVLAGYLEASAKTRASSSTAASTSTAYTTNGGYNDGGGQSGSQGSFGGGQPPSASSGNGSAVSGGS
jgi:uncharacterized membrane protein YgcG